MTLGHFFVVSTSIQDFKKTKCKYGKYWKSRVYCRAVDCACYIFSWYFSCCLADLSGITEEKLLVYMSSMDASATSIMFHAVQHSEGLKFVRHD